MTDKVTLYIGTHNKTGKRYFGKTTKYFTQESLQENYHGSGTYWNNHLKKHGDDVTMEIYGIFSLNKEDEDYVVPIALKFSEENNIVKDYVNWANQKPENGLDGTIPGSKASEETRRKQSESKTGERHWNYGKARSEVTKDKIKFKRQFQVMTEESNKKRSESQIGKIVSEETKRKQSDSLKVKMQDPEIKRKISETQKNKPRVECPYCNKIGAQNLMTRYHFDNCKNKLSE